MAGLGDGPTACCVRGDDTPVELIDPHECQGYEFPVLRKLKNDGTDQAVPEAPWATNKARLSVIEHQKNQAQAYQERVDSRGEPIEGGKNQGQGNTGGYSIKRDSVGELLGDDMPDMDQIRLAENAKAAPAAKAKAKAEARAPKKEEDAARTNDRAPPEKSKKKMLDELYVLKEAWWCSYCCCAGCGCGQRNEARALCRLLTKCCCYRVSCEQQSGDQEGRELEGCCQSILSCCFCHFLCQCPCRPGMPRCICCAEQVHACGRYAQPEVEDHSMSVEVGAQPMFEFLSFDGCTLAWCCCMGCSCKAECLSILKLSYKCCGCALLCEEAMPDCCGDDGLCTCFCTCEKCYSMCNCLPRKEGNPGCALCGKRWKKAKYSGGLGLKSGDASGAAPKQQEMS